MKPSRLAVALLTGVAVTATLTGCIQWFLPATPSNTSQPTGEQVDADLQPYYSQVLQWTSCGNGMQCTTARAPMDWDGGNKSANRAVSTYGYGPAQLRGSCRPSFGRGVQLRAVADEE